MDVCGRIILALDVCGRIIRAKASAEPSCGSADMAHVAIELTSGPSVNQHMFSLLESIKTNKQTQTEIKFMYIINYCQISYIAVGQTVDSAD